MITILVTLLSFVVSKSLTMILIIYKIMQLDGYITKDIVLRIFYKIS